jgi:hypothetical protein
MPFVNLLSVCRTRLKRSSFFDFNDDMEVPLRETGRSFHEINHEDPSHLGRKGALSIGMREQSAREIRWSSIHESRRSNMEPAVVFQQLSLWSAVETAESGINPRLRQHNNCIGQVPNANPAHRSWLIADFDA